MLSIDVEEWFHILDSPAVPSLDGWNSLESRVDESLECILDLLDQYNVKATFFWLGWFFAPRVTVAVLATSVYWNTNLLLCVVTWFWALGGEGTEKRVMKKRIFR